MSSLVVTCALKMMMDVRQLFLSGLIMATGLSSTVNVVIMCMYVCINSFT